MRSSLSLPATGTRLIVPRTTGVSRPRLSPLPVLGSDRCACCTVVYRDRALRSYRAVPGFVANRIEAPLPFGPRIDFCACLSKNVIQFLRYLHDFPSEVLLYHSLSSYRSSVM